MKNKTTKIILLAMLISLGLSTIAQVSINTDGTPPDGSAMLDIKSTNSGLLLPRMNTTQISAISNPAAGLMVFNTDSSDFYGFDGSKWISLITATDTTYWNNTKVPIYTKVDILNLNPEDGDALYNSTDNLYQIFYNNNWIPFAPAYNCWPQPTTSNAGPNQSFTDNTTSTSLLANTPETGNGIGAWSIATGTGGSFADAVSPTTTFTGTNCTDYTLRWTITTDCDNSTDDVAISFNQTAATSNAGPDQSFDATLIATLAANTPETGHGTGAWSIVSGTGGSFAETTSPTTTFTGTNCTDYTLRWTITTDCNYSTDDVAIIFFQCSSLLIDQRDGQNYNTVLIGSQCWIAENLNIGTRIDGSGEQTDNHTFEKYCYDNNTSNCEVYGGLYQWDEMMQYVTTEGAQGICPTGWHLPTDDEYKTMEMHLGMTQAQADVTQDYRGTDQGSKLAGNESLWLNGGLDQNANFGTSGFAGLPGGYRFESGTIFYLTKYTLFWSSSEDGSDAWYRSLYYGNAKVYRYQYGKAYGFSVRCIRD